MQMPQMPTPKLNSGAESHENSSPFAGASADEKSAESTLDLDVPLHEPVKPEIINPAANLSSQAVPPLAPSKGIEVVATRNGFYNQMRYRTGDKFFIRSEQEFGEWMKCVEPYLERKRLEFYRNKKARK